MFGSKFYVRGLNTSAFRLKGEATRRVRVGPAEGGRLRGDSDLDEMGMQPGVSSCS